MTERRLTLIVCAVLIAIAIAFWVQAQRLTFPSSVFPKAVIIAFGLTSALTGIQAAFSKTAGRRLKIGTLRGYLAFLVTVGYALSILAFGIYYPTGGFIVVFLLLHGKGHLQVRSAVFACLVAALVVGIVYLVFSVGLQVTMPQGVLFRAG